MAPRRVLVLDRPVGPQTSIPADPADLIAETAVSISDALEKVSKEGYDAVLCRIDAPEETSFLVRIKKIAPTVPVVAITSGANPALDDLAWDSGADDVRSRAELPEGGPLEFQALIARTRAVLMSSEQLRIDGRELVAQHRRLIARNRVLSQESTDQVREFFTGFRPLLVEDNLDQVLFLKRALGKAGFSLQLPVMRDGVEAVNYLSGDGEFADRGLHPLPTLLILDLKLPRKSGLEVIAWIRSRPEFVRLPIFMLTTSPEHFDQAMALGANDYFTKPMESAGLLEIIRTIVVRWWFFQNACESSKRS